MRQHEVQLVVEGVPIDGFEAYAINTDLVTPCAGWSVTLGSRRRWNKYSGVLYEDAAVQINLDGTQVMAGWIDSIDLETSASGSTIMIEGRDHLKPLVKANVHPNTVIKGLTVAQSVEKVLTQMYRGDNVHVPTVFFDAAANRDVIKRKPTTVKNKGKSKTVLAYSQKEIEQLQPQSGESGFEFIARLLRRNGLWLWGTVGGDLIVSTPDYEQSPSYTIQRPIDDTVSYVKRAKLRRDKTNVPSHVFVVGKGGRKGEASSIVQGRAVDDDWRLWAPMYVKHDEVKTDEEAANIAIQELTRLKQGSFVYECTLKGHVDELTEAYYAIDTIAHVHDEVESLDADMYVTSCTWARDGSETTTRLKLVPLYSLVFSEAEKGSS